MKKHNDFEQSRRLWLKQILLGGGSLAFRSLATGIPLKMLLNPLKASAQTTLSPLRTLILSASQPGCPLNANCPGSYMDPEIVHPADPRMARSTIGLNGNSFDAALPWSTLSQDALNHMHFFHHNTSTGAHGAFRDVMKLQFKVRNSEMMVSSLAPHLQESLGFLQAAPICLAHQQFSYKGAFQPILSPLSIKDALLGSGSQLQNLADLRKQTLDKVFNLYKAHGTQTQRKLLDQVASSHDQAANISENFLNLLSEINGNNPSNQIRAALVLTALKVSPIMTLWIPFGRDNHRDAGFAREIQDHEEGVATLQSTFDLMSQFKDNDYIQNDVVFAWTAVFGRTLKKDKEGRDHNGAHCVTLFMGRSINGGVTGSTSGSTISSGSGAVDDNGDIGRSDLLASMGKTMGASLGLSQDILDEEITAGKVVQAVLRS